MVVQPSSVSPEFLGFPADLEVLALLGDPERQREDEVMTDEKNHILELLIIKSLVILLTGIDMN